MNTDSARLVTDFNGLAALKAQAREDSDEAVDEVARQFESLFIQMMLKGMRDAGFGDDLFDNSQSRMYRDISDQQLAVDMSSAGGIGLAKVIRRQLGGAAEPAPAGSGVTDYFAHPVIAVDRPAVPLVEMKQPEPALAPVAAEVVIDDSRMQESPQAFLQALWPQAETTAAQLGLPTEALLAQAALETGWGRHVMQGRDGRNSHNLFGIKADQRWDGDKVRVTTLEYKDGVAVKTRADFRAYDSYAESFADYADFVKGHPRYQQALQQTSDAPAYFRALQQAGYATDPAYADKINDILNRPEMRQAAFDRAEPVRLAAVAGRN